MHGVKPHAPTIFEAPLRPPLGPPLLDLLPHRQPVAGGGQIDVFVEASGFAANLNLRTNGSKQVVQIESKSEIRGVNITMTKS